MKNYQKGFGVIEMVIIVAIVGLIGAIGWSLYDRQIKSSDDGTTQQAPTDDESTTYTRSTTPPSDWKTYSNEKYKITLSYPADWTVSESVFTKKAGEELQNVYSKDATEIFVLCYKSNANQESCYSQININNQKFSASLDQLRNYYEDNNIEYTETERTIDGHEAVEFRTEAQYNLSAQKVYIVAANDLSYVLTTVYEGDLGSDTTQPLNAQDSLTLFESIKID